MAKEQWQNEQSPYKFEIKGESSPSHVEVYGAIAEGKRPHLIIEDRSDNTGLSVNTEKARTQCIDSISKGMGIKATEANWYVRDKAGHIDSVAVNYVTKTVPNEQFAHWERGGEFNHLNRDEKKKFFPDGKETELRTSLRPRDRDPEGGQGGAPQELKDAFVNKPLDKQRETPLAQKQESPNKPKETPNRSAPQENRTKHTGEKPNDKSGHEYDLSRERLFER